MKLLITAFDPFGGDTVNPALEAVKLLPSKIGTIDIIKLEIPTVFRKSIEKLVAEIKKEAPDFVICVGQAGGRFDITPERVAINIDDARIKDNEGNQPIGTIYEDGENAYFSTLPIKFMVKKIREAGLPASVSNTAGTFVCNHLMYGLLYHIKKGFPNIRGGFVHVPFIPAQVVDRPFPQASLSLQDIVRGLSAGIQAIEESEEDLVIHEGKEF